MLTALLELAAQRRDWNLGRAQGAGLGDVGVPRKILMCNDYIYMYVCMYLSDNVHIYIIYS